jgi:hypothetical protein
VQPVNAPLLSAFLKGLGETGYVEGQAPSDSIGGDLSVDHGQKRELGGVTVGE